jgi:4-hydroxy-3-polyprenylbenzoate decarboxylase
MAALDIASGARPNGAPDAASTVDDLRDFIAAVDSIGELKAIDGADWHLEIGGLTEVAAELIPNPPMLLFDHIKDYPAGYRIVASPLATYRRVALALGLPPDKPKLDLLRLAADKMSTAEQQPIPPVVVPRGPVLENVFTGDDVNVWKFPVPLYHASDGGRYIGSGDAVVNRDPESGYVNFGTYRVQVHDRNLLGLWMSPGQQGRQICQRYWERGESCPVVATFGGDPQTFMASYSQIPWGKSELDVVGGLRRRPVEVIEGPITGLPIPATAEIAIEGEVPPPWIEAREEGPFGEWPGYYSGGTRGTGEDQPVIKVKALYHRNDPVLLSMAPLWPGASFMGMDFRAALLWDQLERSGVQDVMGCWVHTRYMVVVAIKQRYAGHARQAAHGVLSCGAVARHGRHIVIVDEDIDPSDMREVLWAMETRCDPITDIEIVDQCWSTPLDPRMSPAKRAAKDYTNSRAIHYAVRPFAWKDKFPEVSRSPLSLRRSLVEKFRDVLPFPPGS